jgi:S1-C subfamily serine protease
MKGSTMTTAIRPVALVACLAAIVTNVPVHSQQPAALVAPRHTSQLDLDWLDAVVSVEREVTDPRSKATTWLPVGTGFLIQTNAKRVALVTAKHVAALADGGPLKPRLGYRLSGKNKDALITDEWLKTQGAGEWVASSDEDVALRLFVAAPGIVLTSIPESAFINTDTLEPGAPLVVLGFPQGLRSDTLSRTIARRGMLAGLEHGRFIIDAFVFPGTSGGPVIYLPAFQMESAILAEESPLIGEEKLIGVVVDYIPYTDIAISPQTQHTRVTFEENSGLAHVVSIDAVRALLQAPAFVSRDGVPKQP